VYADVLCFLLTAGFDHRRTHQYSSSRTSNNLASVSEGAQLVTALPTSPPSSASMASPTTRNPATVRESWMTAGSSMRSQSPYYQPPAVPTSPGKFGMLDFPKSL
jgi:hypothetical protein